MFPVLRGTTFIWSLVKPHCHLHKRLPYIRNYKGLCVWLNSRLTSFSCTWVSRLRRDLLIVILYMLVFNWFILQVSKFPFCYTLDDSGGGKAMLMGGGGGVVQWGWKTKGFWLSRICHLNKRLPYIRNYKRLCVWFNSRLTSFSCTWVSRLRRDLLIVILYMLAFQLIHCANGKEIHSFNPLTPRSSL